MKIIRTTTQSLEMPDNMSAEEAAALLDGPVFERDDDVAGDDDDADEQDPGDGIDEVAEDADEVDEDAQE